MIPNLSAHSLFGLLFGTEDFVTRNKEYKYVNYMHAYAYVYTEPRSGVQF